METTLEIAGITIRLTVPFTYERTKEFAPFHCTMESEAPDLDIIYQPVDQPLFYEGEPAGTDFYFPGALEKDGHSYLGYHMDRKPCHAWMETDGRKMFCYYLSGWERYFPTERQIFGPVCLEHLLSLHHGFILHSSFIRWKGKGIVFTAPSGTGKSTQADLWVKHEGAELLNGDRTAIRCVDGEWRAYGLPYAGSSAVYRNESCPLAAIVALRQAPENHVELLSGKTAFLSVYSGLTLHPWDEAFMERILSDLDGLLADIPVYRLSCRPDQDAVDTLKRKIGKL
ncbi:MAG: hypothetical protein LUF92_14800 [Clostridiales bacterium]|nr:hypothetical protein [Clostridiales bacterium]